MGGQEFCESGSYTLAFPSTSGCDSIVMLTLEVLPAAQDLNISGKDASCHNSKDPYVAADMGPEATYSWSVTGGVLTGSGIAVDVAWDAGVSTGEICVSASNSCIANATSCKTVQLDSAPELPAIAEQIGVVTEDIRTYLVLNVDASAYYQWSIPADAALLSDQGNSSIQVDWTGSAGGEVCVTAETDCGLSGVACTSVLLTSTQEAQRMPVAGVFPNPASQYLQLQFSEVLPESAELLLHNVNGQQVRSWAVATGTLQQSLSLSDVPAGLYLWSLNTRQGVRLQGGKLVVE